MQVAGVDVGGTNIEAGLVGDDHEVLDRAKAATPSGGPDAVVDTIEKLVASLAGAPAAVGVGIPGVVHEGEVLTVPNLPNWNGHVDLAPDLATRLGVPVALGNDANVGLLGEWLAGSAVGASNVLGVWMGTGVGGALIIDGCPFGGARGAAGEIGHVIVAAGGALCRCGRRGCVEAYAGRRSMEAAAAMMADAGRTTTLWAIRDKLGKATLTSKVWARALAKGDPLATELFSTAIATLAVGVASVVNVLDVDRVVVGGGLAEKLGQDLADRIAAAAAPWMLQPHPRLTFVAAELGDDSGVVGAAALGRALVKSG
ncbi:MAG: ROK family protein [Pseudonocardia sp.]